jgi:hypothetical protein
MRKSAVAKELPINFCASERCESPRWREKFGNAIRKIAASGAETPMIRINFAASDERKPLGWREKFGGKS